MSLAIFEGVFNIWQKLVLTSVNFVDNGAISHGSKWTNNENFESHLVTLRDPDVETVAKPTYTPVRD